MISLHYKGTINSLQRLHKEFERDIYMKIIVTIIPTNLVTNSLLSLFLSFIESKSRNQIFSKLVVWQREIVLLFIYSKLCSTLKTCRIR